ncbi:MAG: alkaline phosphatase family protein [Gemmatimonadales bacterium]|jgi:predicted AlkP superfamily pyrophosphatase or phosphodiesterase
MTLISRLSRMRLRSGAAALEAALLGILLGAASCSPAKAPGEGEASPVPREGEDSRTPGEAVALRGGEGEASRAPEFSGLVVELVIDQLPQFLIDRYDALFVGGFRRLLDEGRVYSRTYHGHARTSTAPGHTTIAAGVYPSRHGVVGNSWREPKGRKWVLVENFLDAGEDLVGLPKGRGFSPRVLETTTLADWLLEADSKTQVLAISGKVRGAVPMAGHGKHHVYVLNDEYGPAFVTSTYYRDSVPYWVRHFNEGPLAELLTDSVWETTVPADAVAASRPDTTTYERRGAHVAFPHGFAAEEEVWPERKHGFMGWFWRTPMLDEASIALAIAGVEALELGRRQGVDLLTIGLSATDPIGHAYGPYSREQLDNLLRLDRELGELFEFLDEAVGQDRYIVALSSDHGVMAAPEYRRELAEVGVRVPVSAMLEALRATDEADAASERELHARRAAILEEYDFVADAMTREELLAIDPSTPLAAAGADSFLVLYRRSFRPDRAISPGERGVFVRLQEGYMVDDAIATHGSAYTYDRHVPLLLMGPGIEAARLDEVAATVDVAPTLARLAGIPYPPDLDGRALIVP